MSRMPPSAASCHACGATKKRCRYLRIGARSDVRAQYNLGVTLFNLKRYDESIRELEVLVAEHPMREEAPWSRRVMGHAYARLSRLARGNRAASHDACDDPDTTPRPEGSSSTRTTAMASNLAQAQKFDEAIAALPPRARAYDDRNASARYNLATALFDAGQLKEAFVEAERALALNPANADAHHLMGKLLALQGRLDESIASFETAVKLRPDDPVIRDDLARVQRLRRKIRLSRRRAAERRDTRQRKRSPRAA